MKYWLFKSEGDCYSIDNLKRDRKTAWTGVRNYQARNFMQEMAVGDLVLFYHSSSKPTGVYGLARVAKSARVDETQFDPRDDHFDPKATRDKPIWYCVGIAFEERFTSAVTLDIIKLDPKLDGMMVRERGSRLSIQPVSEKNFKHIQDLSKIHAKQ